ncbi:MAG: hypothetical protein OCC49_19650 [Fibrobacterales bacterium]
MKSIIILYHFIISRYILTFDSRMRIHRYQQKRLKKVLRTVSKKSLFYKNITANSSQLKDTIEIMSKETMMEHFDTINTVGISKEHAYEYAIKSETDRSFDGRINGYTIGLSSGTSGNRGLFLVSPYEESVWAGKTLAKVLPGPLWQKNRIALFLRSNSNLYESSNAGAISFHYFDMIIPATDHLNRLNTIQPTILIAPPSVLKVIAQCIESRAISLHPIKVISVAEVLDPLDELYLKRIYNQTIHQIYQATEGFIGCTCAHGTLHLNEDLLIIEKEFLPNNPKKFIPIITDLNRTSQPVIRYRLNDILTLKDTPCKCGSALTALECIEGRCDDIFYFLTHTGETIPVYPDFMRRAVITATDMIAEYKIIQTSMSSIEVSIQYGASTSSTESENKKIVSNLNMVFDSYKITHPQVIFTPYRAPLPLAKLKRVERTFTTSEMT